VPRRPRSSTAGLVFHVLNRAAKRALLFQADSDYEAFERVLREAVVRSSIELYAYCVMPNHWHLLLSPTVDGELSRFMHWLTTTHARRWQTTRRLDGQGAVYQGRFKAIAVGNDNHFVCVCRYVERNPLRASLVERAEDWRWSSISHHRRLANTEVPLTTWPIARPADWLALVNAVQTDAELNAVRTAIKKAEPLGGDAWKAALRRRLGIPQRKRGRPVRSRDALFEK
jgi:putative transposase